MKTIWTSLKKNKSFFLFLSILFIFGVVTGILFYFKQDLTIRETIISSLHDLFKTNVFSLKNVFYHVMVLLVIFATLFCFLGIPLFVCYLFFEGLSIGFIIPIFVSLYKVHSIGYFLLYFLLIKFFFLVLLFLLFVKCFHFIKVYLLSLKYRNYEFMSELKYIFFFFILLIINDFVIYFISNRLLLFFLG